LSGYEGYVLAVLAALHKEDIDVTAARLCEVFICCRGERPDAPNFGDKLHLTENGADGAPKAFIVVELAQIFMEFSAKFNRWLADRGR
jgi:hypothetical protein